MWLAWASHWAGIRMECNLNLNLNSYMWPVAPGWDSFITFEECILFASLRTLNGHYYLTSSRKGRETRVVPTLLPVPPWDLFSATMPGLFIPLVWLRSTPKTLFAHCEDCLLSFPHLCCLQTSNFFICRLVISYISFIRHSSKPGTPTTLISTSN